MPPGDTEQTVSVATIEDALDEDDETFVVELSDPVNAVIDDASGTGTILDDDSMPGTAPGEGLNIADAVGTEGGALEFTVSLRKASGRAVSVDWSTSDGTATSADYMAANGTVTFAAGDTEQTVSVATIEDTLDEDDESFVVELSDPVNAVIDDASGTGTILDDDSMPGTVPGEGLGIADDSAIEGGTLSFTVSLGKASGRAVTVDWSTTDGTATSADYMPASGTVTFAAGDTEQTVSVATIEDTLDEDDETFVVELSHPVNAMIDDPRATGTIEDDDGVPVTVPDNGLRIADSTAKEGGTSFLRGKFGIGKRSHGKR